VRVNDKEGEAGNSGGLRRETAKSTHTPVLDWMQQHRRRNWRSCNRGFLLGWDIISTLVLAVGLWHLQLGTYVLTIIPMLKKMPLRQAARVTLVGDIASISAMEIITENSLVFLIPGYSCTQD
jgi:hypothetical protein